MFFSLSIRRRKRLNVLVCFLKFPEPAFATWIKTNLFLLQASKLFSEVAEVNVSLFVYYFLNI